MASSSDETLFHYSLLSLYLIAPPTFISLFFLQAPYGKHNRPGWGPTISPTLAWFLMESPTLFLSLLILPLGQHSSNPKALLLISPFILHYFHRVIIYPLRLKPTTTGGSGGGFPVSVALMAFVFNLLNTYLQARWVSHYNVYHADGWFWWRFLIGFTVFGIGMVVNVWSDKVLLGLKKRGGGGGGYKIPRGGLFELVSCPNYFGEIVEWVGWAIMTGSWVGFGFLVYTCANLVPRARANHRWYLDKFGEDYPKGRKAFILRIASVPLDYVGSKSISDEVLRGKRTRGFSVVASRHYSFNHILHSNFNSLIATYGGCSNTRATSDGSITIGTHSQSNTLSGKLPCSSKFLAEKHLYIVSMSCMLTKTNTAQENV
ncbi:hypothetical protein ACFE04_030363 [Oxalis oulophora]